VDDSVFPLDAATLLSDDQPGLMGRFHGDGQEFTVSVMPQDLQGGLSPSDQDVVDRMIASISFDPWKVGDVRHDWVAIPTPTADISWLQIEGGWYMLFRTPDGDRLYGSISCAGAPPAKTGATSDGFAKLTCGDGSTWEMSADGASGGGGVASSSNDPPPEWPVVKAHDGTLIAFVLPGVFPEGTGGAS
jgi:hypothetical protein